MESLRKEFEKLPDHLLAVYASQLVGRAQLAAKLGQQYGGDRNLYTALGYKTTLTVDDFMVRHQRQEIAKAVIDRPVKATWQGPIKLVESNIPTDTEFEKEWTKLERRLQLKTRLVRVDKLTGLGQYGVLLLGLDDVKSTEMFEQPVMAGKRKLIYVKPFGQRTAEIKTYEENPKNPRYGLPLIYQVSIFDALRQKSSVIKVHYSRIIHIVDGNLESEVFGAPRLEAIYNRLDDIEKIAGGDAEMFWRGARPGFEGKVDPEYMLTPQMREDLLNQVDEYEHDLRRILVNEGIDLKALEQQITDPEPHMNVQLTLISAETGIPKRVLSGSEQGELASTQDAGEWKEYVQARRGDFAEPNIVRPFVDRLIELQVLPTPAEDYMVKWADIFALSEKQRIENGKGRANALREYTYNAMAEMLMPPDAFMEFCMGLDEEQITLVKAMRDKLISDEELSDKVIKGVDQVVDPPKPEVVKPAATTTKKPVAKKKV